MGSRFGVRLRTGPPNGYRFPLDMTLEVANSEGFSMSAGYSGTPLHKQLGFLGNVPVYAHAMPPEVRALIEADVPDIIWCKWGGDIEAAHLFIIRLADLEQRLARVRKRLRPAGFVWVSWPKKTSGVQTDITEDRVREVALALKLVDIKVCAVSEIWSGLKLVIRVKDRAELKPRFRKTD